MPVRPTLLHRMTHVSFRLFQCKNLGNLQECFCANGLPPAHLWQKIARTLTWSGELICRNLFIELNQFDQRDSKALDRTGVDI